MGLGEQDHRGEVPFHQGYLLLTVHAVVTLVTWLKWVCQVLGCEVSPFPSLPHPTLSALDGVPCAQPPLQEQGVTLPI